MKMYRNKTDRKTAGREFGEASQESSLRKSVFKCELLFMTLTSKITILITILISLLLPTEDVYAINFVNASTSHYSNEYKSTGFGTSGSFCDPIGVFYLSEKQFYHSSLAITEAVLPFVISFKGIKVEDRISIPFTVSTPGNYDIALTVWVTGSVHSVGGTFFLAGGAWGDSWIYFDSGIYDSFGEVVSGSLGGRNQICKFEEGLSGLLGETALWGILDVLTVAGSKATRVWKKITTETLRAFDTLWYAAESLENPPCEWNNESYLCSASSYLNPGQYEFRISLFSEVQSNLVAAAVGGHTIRTAINVRLGDIASNIPDPTIVPNSPSNLSVSSSSNSRVNLTWSDNSYDELGFRIYRSNMVPSFPGGHQGMDLVSTVGPNVTTFSDIDVSSGETWCYQVYAYNAVGESPVYHEYLIVVVPEGGGIIPPINLEAQALSHDQIKLTWRDDGTNLASQFMIGRATAPSNDLTNWLWLQSVDVSNEEYISTGLVADTRYYYRMHPVTGQGFHEDIYALVDARTNTVGSDDTGISILYNGIELEFDQDGVYNRYRCRTTLNLGTYEQFGEIPVSFSIQNYSGENIIWRFDIHDSEHFSGLEPNHSIPQDGSGGFTLLVNAYEVGHFTGELVVQWYPVGSPHERTYLTIPIVSEIIPRSGEGPRLVEIGIPTNGILAKGTGILTLDLTFNKAMDFSFLNHRLMPDYSSNFEPAVMLRNEGTSDILIAEWDTMYSSDRTLTYVTFDWADIPVSSYVLTIDDDGFVDQTGARLDGEWSGGWPTGDGTQGGDFVYHFTVTGPKSTNPNPTNGATDQSINVGTSWSNSGGATSYDVYFGTNPTPDDDEYQGNQSSTSYEPLTLDYNTIYYWRIDTHSSYGITTGDVWNFTTEAKATYILNTYVIGGNGIIESGGIYESGTVVSLTAYPVDNYRIKSWSGTDDDSSTDTTNAVTMTGPKTVTVEFEPINNWQNLIISSTSGGAVTTPGEGTYAYDNGTLASVVASPSANFYFVNWTGTAVDAGKVANPNAASTTVTMDADYTIQANFAVDQHTMTFSSMTGGSVTVPGEGGFQYDHGTVVAIQATADANHYLVNWTGTAVDAGKVANPNAAATSVTADADYTIQANFGQQDGAAPMLTGLSPSADDIQVPLNSLIILHITDAGMGVDADSVTIALDGDTIYTGDTTDYNSATGHCCRTGTPADFTYVYQSSQPFGFEEFKTVTVNAADLGGTVMTEQSYSFWTVMWSFGQNRRVDTTIEGLDKAAPSTARDSSGNIWAVWHAGPVGGRDIYIAKLAAGADAFGASLPLISHSADQAYPALAVGADDRLYVVWQDNRQADDNAQGQWDIYLSTSLDGVTWSLETRVNDPNEANQFNPAIVVDSNSPNNNAHVVWQADRAGHQDICIASSSNGFATKTVSQRITNDPSDQTEPTIAVDSSNTIYVLWTDARNPANGYDIYGAASNVGPWMNVPVVSKEANQSSPVIAVESAGSILHMLWVDQTSGDSDIFYASSDGLPGGALAGGNLIDDSSGAEQLMPAIGVTGNTGDGLKVFACWHDERNAFGGAGDIDLYMVQANSGSGTNVFIGDGGANSDQTEPAIATDQYGYPYIVWTDYRGANTEIYFAGVVSYGDPLPTTIVTDGNAVTVEVTTQENLKVEIPELPAGLNADDLDITICELHNPPELPPGGFGVCYDFGPSGLQFNVPVTITIPHAEGDCPGLPIYKVYWYNEQIGAWSQDGITNVQHLTNSDDPTLPFDVHVVRFNADHFSTFGVGAASVGGGGGGGGGGCAMSELPQGPISVIEFLLPLVAFVIVLLVMSWVDARKRTSKGSQ